MQAEELAFARRDLAEWSQPIIVDFLRDIYSGRLGHDHLSLRVLCLSHGRAWRLMLQGDLEKLASARREVTGIARMAGLKTGDIVDIDAAMLDELLDVVVTRFQRAPGRATIYGKVLLGIAGRLSNVAPTSA